jgi:hypothetical protein
LVAALQKSYRGTESRIDVEAAARSALSLMAAEFQLAGSNPTLDTTIAAAVGPCTTPCTVTVQSGASVNVNDKVSVGAGPNYEITSVTAVGNGTFTAALINPHAIGDPVVYPGYPYATGIYYPNCGQPSCTDTKLQIYGNTLGDGKIYFIEYKYDPTNKWITRSQTPITANKKNQAYVLCENVTNASFSVYQDAQLNYTSASITITVQTPYLNPQTGQYQSVTLQRGVVQARNVAIASLMIGSGNGANVAPTPSNAATLSVN